MGIEIRIAVPEDAFAACDVLRRSITECCVADHQHNPDALTAWLGNKTPQNVASWFISPANHALVAERDGAVVGVALLTQAGKLSLCYVLPEALYSGVGKALLQGVEAQARTWGVSVLRLNSTVTASKFYERNGYILAGKEKSCYGLECDFFWKKLNACETNDPSPRKRFCNCTGQ
ncbi:GNAT family N-acetyltransferase [Massilia scottii]|uniref:GNAT family N-acetyltransferase n=1 Tax=Massilia scottii TaxID=3057166 RepID=UPI0027969AC4|nr:GNAT family N-acetyltransferase [Massilia sp. CCM 9029]MDQ1831264.1 GNAT family N-acetyltransferase [Massilia sp. CCM 9029]